MRWRLSKKSFMSQSPFVIAAASLLYMISTSLLAPTVAQPTAVSQFLSPHAVGNASNRLVIRQDGLADQFKDPAVDTATLRGESDDTGKPGGFPNSVSPSEQQGCLGTSISNRFQGAVPVSHRQQATALRRQRM
jgi:hypothetical protein